MDAPDEDEGARTSLTTVLFSVRLAEAHRTCTNDAEEVALDKAEFMSAALLIMGARISEARVRVCSLFGGLKPAAAAALLRRI